MVSEAASWIEWLDRVRWRTLFPHQRNCQFLRGCVKLGSGAAAIRRTSRLHESGYFMKGGFYPLFLLVILMVHPLIPQITEIAQPVAEALGLEFVAAVLHTNQNPPVLRVDVRNLAQDTGLDDCEQMSRALEAALDEAGTIPDAYILEVSSPGLSNQLSADRDFVSFKGFTVSITTTEPYSGHTLWTGQLLRRDEQAIHINQKGRTVKIPRTLVERVLLADAGAE